VRVQVPLALRRFRRVLATELAGPSAALALHNLRRNGVTNASVVRASSAEVAHAVLGAGGGSLAELVAARQTRAPERRGGGGGGGGGGGIAQEELWRHAAAVEAQAASVDPERLSTLLVDPPRSGLDATTIALAQGFRFVLYISCNPTTMLRDVRAMGGDGRRSITLRRFATFDQFPCTWTPSHRDAPALRLLRWLAAVPVPSVVARLTVSNLRGCRRRHRSSGVWGSD
jgi:tRNA (uracil-5-)-methyltransferase